MALWTLDKPNCTTVPHPEIFYIVSIKFMSTMDCGTAVQLLLVIHMEIYLPACSVFFYENWYFSKVPVCREE